MAKQEKVRIYNRLFFKLYLNYAVMLLVTAVLICLIFMKLYSDMTMKNNRVELEERAQLISEYTSDYIISGKSDNYLESIYQLANINGWDIWTVSNPESIQPMGSDMETGETYADFEAQPELEEYVDILKSAFAGKGKYIIGDDKIYDTPTITVAFPVFSKDSVEVVGAILIKQLVGEQPEIVRSSLSLIVLSSVVALAISFVIVIIFATELSLPISRMRATALELAAGNFHSKTGINRDDEIGDLAKTVDILSERLLESDTQRKKT